MWLALLGALALSAPADVVVTTLDSAEVRGTLTELADGRAVLKTAGGVVTIPADKIVRLRPQSAPSPPAVSAPQRVHLLDDSQFVAMHYTVAGKTARFTAAAKEIEVPAKSVAYVQMKKPTDQIARQWEQLLSKVEDKQFSSDLLVIRKGDSIDWLDGVIRDVTAEEVKFESGGEVVPVKRSRVDGLVYFHPARREFPDPLCLFRSSDGSSLRLKSISLKEGGLALETLSEAKLAVSLESFADIDFSAGKVQRLVAGNATPGVELAPLTKKWRTFFNETGAIHQWRQPRSNAWGPQQPLTLRGQVFKHGLALRSRTELDYRLRKKFRRLTALAGIDDQAKGGGKVRLIIHGDDKKLMDEMIVGGADAKTVDLDVSGVSRLVILVDYGVFGGDFLDLCNIRVTK